MYICDVFVMSVLLLKAPNEFIKKKKKEKRGPTRKKLKELNSEQKCVFVFFILPTSLV